MSDTTPSTTIVDRARRAARLTLSTGVRAAAVPVRGVARLGRDENDPRFADVAWLWQPGWGKRCHDRLYRDADPYGIGLNPYEQSKYATVMSTLSGRRYDRALEVGCGEGDLSVRLAGLTDDLLGVDISAAAVERANRRVPAATFERRTLPHEMPEGTFDLIVTTDVLYYWEPVTLRVATATLLDRLRPGGTLLAYHYRGDFGQAGTAERVHAGLRSAAAERGVQNRVQERLDGIGPGGDGALFDVLTRPADARHRTRDVTTAG